MAITKIHSIKATVAGAVNYVCNEKKTDGKVLISSFGCSPESAAMDFKFTLSHTRQSDPNKAFHLIQSFAPGEVKPDEAHIIGNELAEKLLEGKYSYIVATHIDKDHIHNHILFCAADFVNYEKYHDCKKSYYRIRQLNDELCEAHNLSVIREYKNIGKTYKEWQAEKQGNSWKAKLKSDINTAIRQSRTYEDFLKIMTDMGYEIKDAGFTPDDHKYIGFKPEGKDRWIRGREKSLGAEFTKERIKERIEEKAKIRAERMARFIHPSTQLIDTTDAKFEENAGLKRWAERENLKRSAAMYAELNRMGMKSLDELDERIDELHELAKSERKTFISISRQATDLLETLHFARQYEENKKYAFHYEKSKDKERYYRDHFDQIHLFWGARDILEAAEIDPKTLNIPEMEERIEELNERQKKSRIKFQSAEKECEKLKNFRDSLSAFMGNEQSPELDDKNRKHTLE